MENMKKEEALNSRHISLSIGCTKGGHASFRVEDGRFICDCGEDFTNEAEELLEGIKQSLKHHE